MLRLLLGIQVLDRPRTFEKCLKLLLESDRRNDITIVIVNNNSNDETCEMIEKYKKDVDMVITHPWNMGYCFGINSWMSKREMEQHCAIVDQDLFMHSKDWWTIMEDVLNNPKVGVVAARRPTAWIERNDKRTGYRNLYFEQINKRWTEIPRDNMLVGPIVIYKGEVLDAIGFENEATGYEDLDYPIRVKVLGYKSVYIPEVFLYQLGNPTFDKAEDLDEVCKHPQLKAHQDLLQIRASLHTEMIAKYMNTGRVYCGTRWLRETMNDPVYTHYSNENFEFHKRWPNLGDWPNAN